MGGLEGRNSDKDLSFLIGVVGCVNEDSVSLGFLGYFVGYGSGFFGVWYEMIVLVKWLFGILVFG